MILIQKPLRPIFWIIFFGCVPYLIVSSTRDRGPRVGIYEDVQYFFLHGPHDPIGQSHHSVPSTLIIFLFSNVNVVHGLMRRAMVGVRLIVHRVVSLGMSVAS